MVKMMKAERRRATVGAGIVAASVALAMLAACAAQSTPSAGYVGAVAPGLLTSVSSAVEPKETPSKVPVENVEPVAVEEDALQTDTGAAGEAVPEEPTVQDSASSSPAETSQSQVQTQVSQGSSASDSASTPSCDQPSASAKVHEHSWEPVLEKREVVDVAAYEETQYKTEERIICSVCGADITNGDGQGRSIMEHGKAHTLAGEGGGTYSTTKSVPCGTISHPAQTHFEEVTVGYRCSCGATK